MKYSWDRSHCHCRILQNETWRIRTPDNLIKRHSRDTGTPMKSSFSPLNRLKAIFKGKFLFQGYHINSKKATAVFSQQLPFPAGQACCFSLSCYFSLSFYCFHQRCSGITYNLTVFHCLRSTVL